MANAKSFPLPSRNVYWRDIPPGEDVEVRKSCFVAYRGGIPDAVVFWHGQEAQEAQQALNKRAFARCSRDDCGIRVDKLGDECGNHR